MFFRTPLENETKKAKEFQLKRCKTTTEYTPEMGVIDDDKKLSNFTQRDHDCHDATKALMELQKVYRCQR